MTQNTFLQFSCILIYILRAFIGQFEQKLFFMINVIGISESNLIVIRSASTFGTS